MWQLTAKYGRRKGRSWPMNGTDITIGRNPECTVSLKDPLVSREHCTVRLEGDHLVIEDLGSANATLVNGRPVTRCALDVGDEVVVGEATFVVTQSMLDDPATGTPIGLHTTRCVFDRSPLFWDGAEDGSNSLTVPELAQLHRLGNAAASSKDEETLFKALVDCIYDRCAPIQLFLRTGSTLFRYPATMELDEATVHAIDAAMEKRPKQPKFIKADMADGPDTFTAVLPVWSGERFAGVFGGVHESKTPGQLEPDLKFAMNVTRVVAPFLYTFAAETRGNGLRSEKRAAAYLGESEAARDARRLIALAAGSDIPVLIQGETGTGKELAAETIHHLSDRSDGPFVPTNCAAISDELFESEVFGHVKGAFTGAHANREGLLTEASGGYIFLDEISDLSPRNQSRLLRAIETQRFRPVGATTDQVADFGVISASNRDLWAEVEAGRFRADLYYRLAGIELFLPPLAARASDIPMLIEAFAAEFAEKRRVAPAKLAPDAIEYLTSLPWRGNVRELRNCINRVAAFAAGETVSRAKLEGILARPSAAQREHAVRIGDVEREHIEKVLADCGGRIQDAARVLGIHRNTLAKKLKRYRDFE
jgi:DNA-binding NtrC family response regulator